MTNAHKPYSPSAECRYFLYDPNDGHRFYSTPEERDAAAKDSIKAYLDDGEWSEQVIDIYVGEATHQVTEIERLNKAGELDEDGYDENGEYWGPDGDEIDYKCDYGLCPLAFSPPPAEGEVAELVAIAADSCADDGFPNEARVCRRAAALLRQQAAELERLRVVPVAVSERLPEAKEMTEDDEVWIEDPGHEYPLADSGDYDWDPHKWVLRPISKFDAKNGRRWLPAHALPLPSGEVGE